MKKFPKKINRVGLIANSEKPESRSVAQKAAALLARTGHDICCDIATAEMVGLKTVSYPDPASLARQVDLLLVFGGDGSMLRVVREIEGALTPILGVNVGRLGFLTAVPSRELPRALDKIWKNDFEIESRPLLEARGEGRGKKILLRALNDIVISRGAAPRMIELEVTVNGQVLTCYRCDGLIISSPTGSTAYSLSAGGAIVSPDAQVFAITPICPHTLSNRSVIVSSNAIVQVKVISEKVETTATADGQVQADLDAGDVITIRRNRRVAQLLHPGGSSFFETLRRKLHWSGSNV
ncbi:MAG: NAD(+)/NADH kinase [Verrucomicrobiota bacterium]